MKKTIIFTGAALFLFAASLNAQTDTVPQQPVTPEVPVTSQSQRSADKWNNPDTSKYRLAPMPGALTPEKIFPAIGKYQVTDKDGNALSLTTTLDESNKGILWINGLPEGSIKAYLKTAPAVYKIPVQKTADEKEIKEGVLIYDKDANTINICLGCTYNAENPAVAFSPEEPAVAPEPETPKKNSKNSKKSTAKVAVVKPVIYSGSKVSTETASLEVNAPVQ